MSMRKRLALGVVLAAGIAPALAQPTSSCPYYYPIRAVGAACTVPLPSAARVEGEVVGFEAEKLFLMPQSDVEGIVHVAV